MKPAVKSDPSEKPQTLILLTLEGLAPSSLGCYGSSWNRTPAIDRIASEGCLWDRMIATDDDPIAIMRQWCADENSLEPYRSAGSVELITDDHRLDTDEFEELFDIVAFVDPEQMPDALKAADRIEQTQLAQLILLAIERCRDPEPLGVLWLHSRFLTSRWDAPRDLIPPDELDDDLDIPSEDPEYLSEESDPQILAHSVEIPFLYEDVAPPAILIDQQTHPDVVTSWMRTYACQVRLVDELVEFWMASFDRRHPHFIIAGTSGFALGQNGWIGNQAGPLRSSDIRLPVIVRKSDLHGTTSSLRVPNVMPSTCMGSILKGLCESSPAIVSPEHWCQTHEEFQPSIMTRSNRARVAVTTPKWFCVDRHKNDPLSVDPTPRDTSLFLKPDDVDDVNDVGRLRADVIDQLISIVKSANS